MPFINDPWWIKVRYIVFFMYWAIFVVIFILACIISIMNLNECSLNMLSTVNTDPMMSSTTTQSYGSTVSSIVNSSTAQTTIDTILSPLIDIVTNSSGSLSKLNWWETKKDKLDFVSKIVILFNYLGLNSISCILILHIR